LGESDCAGADTLIGYTQVAFEVRVVYHVYLMASASSVLYLGVTGHLERRVLRHKTKANVGFSSRYKTTKLVYFEPFGRAKSAIAREKQIKKWRREKKLELIEEMNPEWRDLSEDFHR
jgi:putative endonuclease